MNFSPVPTLTTKAAENTKFCDRPRFFVIFVLSVVPFGFRFFFAFFVVILP